MPEMICVLDKLGTVIAVNQSWRDFHDSDLSAGQSINYAIGQAYLDAFSSVLGGRAEHALLMAQGLSDVLGGERDLFELEYLVQTQTDKCFYFARVKCFIGDSGHVLVAHGDITDRKLLALELARLAQTDELTGLHNRRHFTQLSETELSRTARHGGPLSVLMLDIDHFKHVNDTHGHQVGDKVIQVLASICRAQLRDLDVIGRLGGEEFAVTMPSADNAQAYVVANRLRQAIEFASIHLHESVPLRFTVSIGISTLSNEFKTLDALLKEADAALYRAKKNGRNQVCV